MCLHHEIANRNLISFTQREMIKPQQLSRYLALQRPGIEGDLPGGEVGLEKPGTWGRAPRRSSHSLSHLLHLGPAPAASMQITQEPHLHTHQLISISPSSG